MGRWRAVRLARGPVGGVVLVLLCLAVYLPGLFQIPPVDRDEARFAQASRQMFESVALPEARRDPALHDGGWVIPKVQDRPRLNKPPLIYWAQVVSAAVFTGGDPLADAVWMYRLPSAVFATLAVLLIWRVGSSMFDPRAGWVGAALLAVCPMVVWDAHQARADQLLLACTALAVWGLWEVWSRARRGRAGWRWPVVMWVGVGLGVLTKGPITPMVVILTALALALVTRRWRWLRAARPLTGLGIVGVIVGPWVLAVVDKVGFGAYWSIVSGETIGRSGSAMEGHWGPPGYHLFFLVPLFWPGVLLTALALGRAWSRARGVMLNPPETIEPGTIEPGTIHPEPIEPETDETAEGETDATKGPSILGRFLLRARAFLFAIAAPAPGRSAELFCLAWIAPSWLVFELIATKLPHYTLPLYPPIALLTARALLAAADGMLRGVSGDTARLGHWVWLAVGVLFVAVAPVGVAVFGDMPVLLAGVLVALAAGELLRRAWKRLGSGHFAVAQAWSVASMVVAFAGLLGVVLPNADGLWLSPQLASLIEQADNRENRPVAAVGYHEDSLVFLTRGRLERIDDARAWLRAHRDGVLVARPEDIILDDLRLPDLERVGEIKGVNYSRGDFLVLGVYEAAR